METNKIFKLGDTVKCIHNKIVHTLESSPNKLFDLNTEYVIKDIDSDGNIIVCGCNRFVSPKNFAKVLKTAKDKEFLLDYLKSLPISIDGSYVFDVENALMYFDYNLITYDLITKSNKPDTLFPQTDWKTVHPHQTLWYSEYELFKESQKKIHDDVQAQILAEKKAKAHREILAEILKQDKFIDIYTINDDKLRLAKQLFLFFTEYKPQLFETIDGISNVTVLDGYYQCDIIGKPFDPKFASDGSCGRLKIMGDVGKKRLESFLNSKIEPSRPALGLTPIEIRERDFKINRFNEVCEAISRHYNAGNIIPPSWITEYNNLVEFVKNETKQGL